jgi:hypothetical protein
MMPRTVWFTAVELLHWPAGQAAPEPLHHAKSFGTTLTACGMNAGTWPRLWDHPFPSGTERRCSRCMDAVLLKRNSQLTTH